MSAEKMKQLTTTQNVWDSPLQFGAMALLAWFHSEKTDYASVSFGYIARQCGVDRRYVMRAMESLELEKHACINLGPDPDQGGRNRWAVTIERAVAKVRRDAGVGDDVPLQRIKRVRARTRRSTVVIPGPPEKERNDGVGDGEPDLREISGGPERGVLVVQGSPGGDPRITGVVVQGPPQSAQGTYKGSQLLRSTADADASAASSLEFHLVGETPAASRVAREAKAAHDARRSRLYQRIVRQARWVLEHPAEGTALNGGAAIVDEAGLVEATKWRCARKRIPGYGEGDVLTSACRSEWHLFKVRQGLVVTSRRDLRETRRRR